MVLHNSDDTSSMPCNVVPLFLPAAQAPHSRSFLDRTAKSACQEQARPARREGVCNQTSSSKTAFTKPPISVQALPDDLQHRQSRQQSDFPLGATPNALIAPNCCQTRTAAFEEMQPDAPTDTTSQLGSLINSAIEMPEPLELSQVHASYAAGTTRHKQAQTGSAAAPAAQQLTLNHQPEAALQDRPHPITARHCLSRPADTPSLLPHQLSTLDAQVSVSELSVSASSSSAANMSVEQLHSQMTDSPVAAVKAVLDCSVGRH